LDECGAIDEYLDERWMKNVVTDRG